MNVEMASEAKEFISLFLDKELSKKQPNLEVRPAGL